MPIKFTKHEPPPVPQPPATYSITGLYKQDVIAVKAALMAGIGHVANPNNRERLDRIIRTIIINEE
jgi:hypothetical protein